MKAYRLFAILAIAVFVLAACAPAAATEAPAAAADTAGAGLPDLGGKEIKIAVENAYPPFNFIDASTNAGNGWDYDAWIAICKHLNCKPVFTEAAWEGIFEAAAAGEYDVVADGVTITEERKQKVAFSQSYMHYGQVFLVRADESRFTDSKGIAADASIVLASQIGTSNEAKAIEIAGEDRVKSFDTFDAAVMALLSKDVDAVVVDQPVALGYMAINQGKLKHLDELLTSEDLGFVYKQGSDLVAPVDAAIDAMRASGELDALYKKWFVDYVPAQ